MLSCLFGKCQSKTYVVNTDIPKINGVTTIVPQPDNGNGQVTVLQQNSNGIQQTNTQIQVTDNPPIQSDADHSQANHVEVLPNIESDNKVSQSENQTKFKSQAPQPPQQITDNRKSDNSKIKLSEEFSKKELMVVKGTVANNTTQEQVIQPVENSPFENSTTVKETSQTKIIQNEAPILNLSSTNVTVSDITSQAEITRNVLNEPTENVLPKNSEISQAKTIKNEQHVVNSITKDVTMSDDPSHGEAIRNEEPTVNPSSKHNVGKDTLRPEPIQNKESVVSSSSTKGDGQSETVKPSEQLKIDPRPTDDTEEDQPRRRSGITALPVKYDEVQSKLPIITKSLDEEALIRQAIEQNDFLNKIISSKRLEDVINAMYSREVATKETIVKQGEKGSHMYISAKGTFQVLIKNKVVSEFNDIRVFGELAILYNAKRLATIRAITPGRVWVLDRNVYQQIVVRYNIKEQDETMQFLMNNEVLKVAGKEALQEVANLLKSEFFKPGTQIVKQGDKGYKFYIIRAGTVTITKDGEGVVGKRKKGDCFGELALLKEDCRQATVTADAPGVECLTLTRKEFIDHFGELKEWEDIKINPQNSFKDGEMEYGEIDLRDLKMIKTLGVGGFGRVELVQHKKKNDHVFALKYLKKIDIVMQHQQEHVYNEKNIQMACKSPFIVRLYRTYKDNKYIYLLMESCLGGDLWSLLQKQKQRRFEEKEARFIAACVLETFDYLHSRGIIYRDLKPENLLIAANGYIKLTDFGFAKKISSRGKTFTFAGTPEYVAPEIVLNRGHDRSVDYWAFGAFIFELLTGRTPFRTDDPSHMKTYNKILNGIDNVQFPSYVNLKARHIIEKLCRPVPSERLGMQRGGIKDIKSHKWFLGFDWQKFAKCEITSPFKPNLKSSIDTKYFDQFKKDTDSPPDETSGWDRQF